MSNQPPHDSSGPLDHLTLRYLRQMADSSHPADEPYVLNEVEAWVIRRVRQRTLMLAAGIGVLAVLFIYLPHYFWPGFFEELSLTVLGATYMIPLISVLYTALIVYTEVYVLMYVNLNAIRTIMAICQFPQTHDPQYEKHLREMALEAEKNQYWDLFGLSADPHFGRPGWGLMPFFWVNTTRAVASDFVLRVLMVRLAGRYVFRQVADLIAMPVVAFWNVLASRQILREAQIRVMAPITVHSFVDELYEEWGKNAEFVQLMPFVLKCVGVQKRQYNYAHHLLTEAIEHRFTIKLDWSDQQEPDKPANLPIGIRTGLERLIIFAALVDGRLSTAEKKCLRYLRTQGWITYTLADVEQIGRQYNAGKGLWV